MAIGKDRTVERQLRTVIHLGAVGDLSDGQLLERFATGRGEAAELAFATLVERHGPMVLRVCRSILGDRDDSQDAFQATFLVLARKGRSLWVRDSLGPWLQQVAHRTASCARSTAARRQRLELQAGRSRSESAKRTQREPGDDLERVLLEEIDRLPERFRAPVVLCDLEGQTHAAAARALGWPIGTVKSRQARARDRLRDQLTRRGFAPTTGLGLVAWPDLTLPTALIASTTRLAARFGLPRTIVSGPPAGLAQEVLHSMTILRSVKFASVLLALGTVGSGIGLIAQGAGQAPKKAQQAAPLSPIANEAKGQENQTPTEPPIDPALVRVKPSKFEVTESTDGILEPAKAINLVSEVEGATALITIQPEGTQVSKGEIVAELDSASLRDTLLNQRIAVQQSEAAYKSAGLAREIAEFAAKESLEGTLPAERAKQTRKIADAERGVKDGEARLERTKDARKRLNYALTKTINTASDIVADLTVNDLLEAAERNLSDQKQTLELARKDQEILEKFTREKTTRQVRVDLENARGYELAQQSRLGQAELKQRNLENQIKKCSIVAPGDGMLVYARRSAAGGTSAVIEAGATIRERQFLCRIIPKDAPMRVRGRIDESNMGRVKPGQKAKVQFLSMPGQTFPGTVTTISPIGEPDGQPGSNGRVYPILIQVDLGGANLPPETSATAEIVVEELDHVFHVPLSSLWVKVTQGQPNQDVVTVKTAQGKTEVRSVKVVDYDMKLGGTVIREGLKAGDLVFRDPHDADRERSGLGLPPAEPIRQPRRVDDPNQ